MGGGAEEEEGAGGAGGGRHRGVIVLVLVVLVLVIVLVTHTRLSKPLSYTCTTARGKGCCRSKGNGHVQGEGSRSVVQGKGHAEDVGEAKAVVEEFQRLL